jgi:predicted nucleic acid-binding Zn ribbon protein
MQVPQPHSRFTKATPMKEAFEAFLQAYRLKNKYNETYLVAYWEKLMGSSIANHTQRIYVNNKVLYLKLDSAPLRQELFMAQTKIIEIINNEVEKGVVEKIVFS